MRRFTHYEMRGKKKFTYILSQRYYVTYARLNIGIFYSKQKLQNNRMKINSSINHDVINN